MVSDCKCGRGGVLLAGRSAALSQQMWVSHTVPLDCLFACKLTGTTKAESTPVDIESTALNALEILRSSPTGPSPDSAASKPTEGVASSSDTIMSSDSSVEKPALTMEDFVEIDKAHYTFPERLVELLEEGDVETAMW